MARPSIFIVAPAPAAADSGDWQTARRWARLLAGDYRTRIAAHWSGQPADLMIALDAARCADAIAAWSGQLVKAPLVVALTGAEAYRDSLGDAAVRHSLHLADRLIAQQDMGPRSLSAALRARTAVILQSGARRRRLAKTRRHLRALMVGPLSPERSPETWFKAARILAERDDILLDHVGAPLDAGLADAAYATQADCPRYRWLGGLAHAQALKRIQRAHLLVQAGRAAGGAHALLEAVRSGTPVLAARIDGHVGMLGEDYQGYFRWSNAAQLAALLVRCREGMAAPDGGLLGRIAGQCDERSSLFEPAREAAQLRALLGALLRPG